MHFSKTNWNGQGLLYSLKWKFIMKVSFIITTLLSLQISLLANAQTEISLSVKKEPLRNVLSLIEKHSGYRFLYTDDPVFENSRVTIKVQKAAFEEVMSKILAGTGLGYTVNNNELVVLSFTPSASQALIKGRVLDEEGNPLSGVTVQIKGTNTSAVTNADGEFSIDAGSNATLVFSSVGFITREMAAGSNAVASVRLSTDKIGLSEVVVTALGISREKKSLGYSTQKVDGAQLNESPASNFINGVAGKVAGVQISGTGAVGGSSRITIRGESSLNMQGNQPLICN